MTVSHKKYKWRVVWLCVGIVVALASIGSVVMHVYTGVSNWRLVFDILRAVLFSVNAVIQWNVVRKMRKERALE